MLRLYSCACAVGVSSLTVSDVVVSRLDKNEANPAWRYKGAFVDAANHYSAYTLEASPDGVHWTPIVSKTASISDCSRIFYNPFRKTWAFSIKTVIESLGRQRAYWERPHFFHGPGWGAAGWSPTATHPPPGAAFPWPTVDFDDSSDPLAPRLLSGQKMPQDLLPTGQAAYVHTYPQVYYLRSLAMMQACIYLFSRTIYI